MSGFGWQELLIILFILFLLFGATKLPSLARSLGSSVHSFKKGLNEDVVDEPALVKAESDDESAGTSA